MSKRGSLIFLIYFILNFSFLVAVNIEESFENGFPVDWTLSPESGDGSWCVTDDLSHGPDSIEHGEHAIMFNNYTYHSNIAGSFITPAFDASEDALVHLTFLWWNGDYESTPAHINIYTKSGDEDFELVDSIAAFGTDEWIFNEYYLSNETTQIKFEGRSDFGLKNTFIDNILVNSVEDQGYFIIPQEYDFGYEGVGLSTKPVSFTIENSGEEDVTIHNISFENGSSNDFSLSTMEFPVELTPGDSYTFEATFHPIYSTYRFIRILVEINDDRQYISLNGEGEDTGVISGYITDAADETPIEGASIELSSQTLISDSEGFYSGEVVIGDHPVLASAPYYDPVSLYSVPISSEQDITRNFSLSNILYDAPYVEEFEAHDLPVGWIRRKGLLIENTTLTDVISRWIKFYFLNGSDSGAKVTYYSNIKDWLITPFFNATNNNLNYRLEFDMGITSFYESTSASMGSEDKFIIVVSSDNGNTWSINNAILTIDQNSAPNNIGTHVSIDLSEYNGELLFGFYAESALVDEAYDYHIDNVEFTNENSSTIDLDLQDFNNGTATLTWEHGVYDDVSEYLVYLDGELQEIVQSNSYTFTGLESSNYNMGVEVRRTNNISYLYTENFQLTAIDDFSSTMVVMGNYPNPFNPTTTISFSIPTDSEVDLSIYNIKGQKVRTLKKEYLEKGRHEVLWDGKNSFNNSVASGVYFYQLNVDGKEQAVKKMLLLK